ncbi:MAG: hypothetical protein HYW26_00450 [Candidatus Aenigmarchaeota archaeon]|nr:hypothetical protein [Candidatus Aenigmarchaeota archaeon]
MQKIPYGRKGVSPLIAAVLLIAFTMAIAGIMATWATTFSQQKLATSEEKSNCIGALDLSTAAFSDKIVSVQVKNLKTNLNLSSLTANVIFADPAKSKAHSNIAMKNFNVSDPMPPGFSDWFIYNTSDATKPLRIEVYAGNCGPDFTAKLSIS